MIEHSSDKDKPDPMPDPSVFGAMRVDPRQYRANWNHNLYERTKYALAGLLYLIRRERSVRKILLGGAVTFALAAWLDVPVVHYVILILTFGLLWTVETINSAIEAVVDMVTQEYHPMARVAKDVAASATFVATLTTMSISLVLVGAPLLTRLLEMTR